MPWTGILLAAALLGGAVSGARAQETTVSSRIRSVLADRADETRTFYDARGYRAAWLEPDGRRAAALIRALRGADAEGLPPERYDVDRITALAHAGPEPDNIARLDVLLTDAIVRYARDVSVGQVDPRDVHGGWKRAPRPFDAAAVLAHLVADDDIEATLAALAPTDPAYARLRTALADYRAIAARGDWPRVPDVRLAQDDTSDAATLLRVRLAAEDGGPEDPSSLFDAELTARVVAFQQRHGLEPDGIVGKRTHAALAVTAGQRARQLALAMERIRWASPATDSLRIEVRIPEFVLRALRGDDIVMQMRVIGGSRSWPTPIFDATVEALTINPSWNVPRRIATLEILPAVRRDPSYLAAHDMQVLTGSGRVVDPATIDWHSMTARTFAYRFRQTPGPANPLGIVKLVLPNPFDVYLHDTPAKSLFTRADRALSHGCIRLERALDLARLVQGEAPGADVATIVATRKETHASITPTVPVSIRYATAWVDASGTVHFREDLYGHDAVLAKRLEGRTLTLPPPSAATICGA